MIGREAASRDPSAFADITCSTHMHMWSVNRSWLSLSLIHCLCVCDCRSVNAVERGTVHDECSMWLRAAARAHASSSLRSLWQTQFEQGQPTCRACPYLTSCKYVIAVISVGHMKDVWYSTPHCYSNVKGYNMTWVNRGHVRETDSYYTGSKSYQFLPCDAMLVQY